MLIEPDIELTVDEDIVLWHSISRGDKKAFDDFFMKYYTLLYGYSRYYVSAEDAKEVLQELMMWLWENRATFVPDTTSSLRQYLITKDYGIDDYEVTLESIDLEELDSVNDITEALNELLTFDRSSLSQSQQITYDELKRYLETQLEYSDLYLFNTQLSTTIGIQVQLPLIFAEYSFEEEKDITEYITLMCDTDRFFQNIVDYETLRSKAGYFMQDELANEIITQCQTFVQSVDSGFLITTFDERLNSLNNISDEQKAEYKKQNLSAIQEHLVKGA